MNHNSDLFYSISRYFLSLLPRNYFVVIEHDNCAVCFMREQMRKGQNIAKQHITNTNVFHDFFLVSWLWGSVDFLWILIDFMECILFHPRLCLFTLRGCKLFPRLIHVGIFVAADVKLYLCIRAPATLLYVCHLQHLDVMAT